jgi:hypothetical protein
MRTTVQLGFAFIDVMAHVAHIPYLMPDASHHPGMEGAPEFTLSDTSSMELPVRDVLVDKGQQA